MNPEKQKKVIGRAEIVSFPDLGLDNINARIDTGAKTSALWASQAHVTDGILHVVFFAKESNHYIAKTFRFEDFETVAVASSNGHIQKRFKVKLLLKIKGKKVRAWFTLADRSSQVYPVLIGRNILLGKFVVDVKRGQPLKEAEQQRSEYLQSGVDEDMKDEEN